MSSEKMNHSKRADVEDSGAALPEVASLLPQKDPVCGMIVNPEAARFKTVHNNSQYFFCCAACLKSLKLIRKKY
jgi:Uncharacterized conserved protein